jgi:phage/plasmid-associated DNA primase
MARWENEKDSVYCFLHDDEVVGGGDCARVERKKFYRAYKYWCSDAGLRAVGRNQFIARCKQKYVEVQVRGFWNFDGVRLVGRIDGISSDGEKKYF